MEMHRIGGILDVTSESGSILQLIHEGQPGGRRRQRLSVFVIQLDRLIDDHAKFFKDLPLIVAMASAIDQPRRTAQ